MLCSFRTSSGISGGSLGMLWQTFCWWLLPEKGSYGLLWLLAKDLASLMSSGNYPWQKRVWGFRYNHLLVTEDGEGLQQVLGRGLSEKQELRTLSSAIETAERCRSLYRRGLETVPVLNSGGDAPQDGVFSTHRNNYPRTAEDLIQTELWRKAAGLGLWEHDIPHWRQGDGLLPCRRCGLHGHPKKYVLVRVTEDYYCTTFSLLEIWCHFGSVWSTSSRKIDIWVFFKDEEFSRIISLLLKLGLFSYLWCSQQSCWGSD